MFERISPEAAGIFSEKVLRFVKMDDKYYDSSAAYMMNVVVEKLTGMAFLEYMKEKSAA